MDARKIATFIAGCVWWWLGAGAQSVSQQCLTEQIRNNNILNQQQQNTAEGATLSAFQSICLNYQGYIQCFQTRLPTSNDLADAFLTLVFDPRSMNTAYRGLCKDLDEIEENIQCLLSTPQVRQCYDIFNQGVQQVIQVQNQGQLPRITLQDLACNVSVARYQCETAVYRFCNRDTGRIMEDFFFAGVPQECRDVTGVRSRYIDMWGGASSVKSSNHLFIFTAAVLMLGVFQIV